MEEGEDEANMISKKQTALLSVTLIATFACAYVLGQVMLPQKYIYLTVDEAISIAPDSVAIKLYVGETKTAEFIITNVADVEIPLSLSATVTSVPEGGRAEDVILDYPATVGAPTGSTTVAISISLATGSVTGDYTITLSPTRV